MNILFKENEITFGELRKRLDISEGSLHNHFRYLEKDKIVTYRKEFREEERTTIYSITEKGIDEFTKLREDYLSFKITLIHVICFVSFSPILHD